MHKIEFIADGHKYFVDSVEKPSVTTVLSEVGAKDRNGNWHSVSGAEFMGFSDQNAMRFGTEVHFAVAHTILGDIGEYEIDPLIQPWVEQAALFIGEHPEIFNVDGTDMIGRRVVLDWKTGAWQDHWWYQLAAYTAMLDYSLREFGLSAGTHVEQLLYDPALDVCGTADVVLVGTPEEGRYHKEWKDEYWVVQLQENRHVIEKHTSIHHAWDKHKFMSILNTHNLFRR